MSNPSRQANTCRHMHFPAKHFLTHLLLPTLVSTQVLLPRLDCPSPLPRSGSRPKRQSAQPLKTARGSSIPLRILRTPHAPALPPAENSERVIDSEQNSEDAPRASAPTRRKQCEGRHSRREFRGRPMREGRHSRREFRGRPNARGSSFAPRISRTPNARGSSFAPRISRTLHPPTLRQATATERVVIRAENFEAAPRASAKNFEGAPRASAILRNCCGSC